MGLVFERHFCIGALLKKGIPKNIGWKPCGSKTRRLLVEQIETKELLIASYCDENSSDLQVMRFPNQSLTHPYLTEMTFFYYINDKGSDKTIVDLFFEF